MFNNIFAETERTLNTIGCGETAKHFEPVETLVEIPFGGQAK
jgi:hypothetical protein